MHTRFRVKALLALMAMAPLPGAAQPAGTQHDAVTLPPVVVAESKAEAFYLRVGEGEITRLWFVSLDRPGSGSLPADARDLKSWGYLVAFRSHEVRPGDEILSIADKPVAEMKKREWMRALGSASDQPPVVVTVRRAGAKDVRRAAVVPQNSVALGAKVQRAAPLRVSPSP